jgi:geranylgeranylglycerol-phosphate geranylgeranyltransferase
MQLKKISKLIENIETRPDISYYLLSAFFFMGSRCVLESISNGNKLHLEQFTHFYLWYFALFSSIILLFHFVTGVPVGKTARVVLVSTAIIHLPPLVDLLLSGGATTYHMSYLLCSDFNQLFLKYQTFFGNFYISGITPGIRVEVALVTIFGGVYSWLKRKSILRAIVMALSLYTLIFCFCAEPFLASSVLKLVGIEFQGGLGATESYHWFMAQFNLLLFFIFTLLILFRWVPEKMLAIVRDIRALRLIHFELMMVLGFLLGVRINSQPLSFGAYLQFLIAVIAVAFAWLYSVITNNWVDIDIDRISNAKRPLVTGAFNASEYQGLSWMVLAAALFFAGLASTHTFIIVLFFIGNYFIYSMPPIRFKRVPVFSKLVIAINSFGLIILGSILGGNTNEIWAFSLNGSLLFIFGLMLSINFIDLKDYDGDKAAGIMTLPVFLGMKRSQLLIGFFFLFNYSVLALAIIYKLNSPMVGYAMLALGVILFLLINRKIYREREVFLVYLLSNVFFCLYLFWGNGAELLLK